ncbi:hypothetical protein [Amycolatopsis suaedae]|uniref:Uncharacterized protein n=1 Tax=Amycolatopsis suaedae TaxID=2510978 RepID=A0A4Q7JFQ2_9PSEU|nr:hypothetical protein [Amycolatopsis suaedae]RZQ66072.1 hypothetical protein EWH70_03155 [Amycolatopsis suaedae]
MANKLLGGAGLVLCVLGVSGTIDHLLHQPFFGPVLNVFNRYVIPNIDALDGYELFANLFVAAVGLLLLLFANRSRANVS